MKNYVQFLFENKYKITDDDWFFYVYKNFFKVLKLHEEVFHNDTKISDSKKFKQEINNMFSEWKNGYTFKNRLDNFEVNGGIKEYMKFITADPVANLTKKYEMELYGEEKFIQDDIDSSWYSFLTLVFEDLDEGETNIWIDEFSNNDVILDKYDYSEKNELYDKYPDYLDKLGEVRDITKSFLQKAFKNSKSEESSYEKLLKMYNDVKKDAKMQHPVHQLLLSEYIEETEQDLEQAKKNKPFVEKAKEKLKKIIDKYEKEYKEDELGLIVNLKMKLEQELEENEEDEIYTDELDLYIYELNVLLKDKGI